MAVRALADAVLLVHLAFILFVVAGGFLARSRPWVARLHIPVVVYAVVIEAVGFTCPLTPLEKNLRLRAGQAGYEGGFVENYVVSIIYPGGLTPPVRVLLVVGLMLSVGLAYRPIVMRERTLTRRQGCRA